MAQFGLMIRFFEDCGHDLLLSLGFMSGCSGSCRVATATHLPLPLGFLSGCSVAAARGLPSSVSLLSTALPPTSLLPAPSAPPCPPCRHMPYTPPQCGIDVCLFYHRQPSCASA